MDFKVNWDNGVWCATVIAMVVLAAGATAALILGETPWKWVVIAIIAAAILALVMMAPLKLRITSSGIVLFKLLGHRRFLYSEMADIRLCDLQRSINVRLAGSGGVLGYNGWFYNKQLGRYHAYVGSMFRTVLISMNNGRNYVVSCLNPDKFVEVARSNLRKAKNRRNLQ